MFILEDLWSGNIQPYEQGFRRGDEYAKAIQQTVEAENELYDILDEKGKAAFQKYQTAQREVMVITDCQTFSKGFRLGAKIILDVLGE